MAATVVAARVRRTVSIATRNPGKNSPVTAHDDLLALADRYWDSVMEAQPTSATLVGITGSTTASKTCRWRRRSASRPPGGRWPTRSRRCHPELDATDQVTRSLLAVERLAQGIEGLDRRLTELASDQMDGVHAGLLSSAPEVNAPTPENAAALVERHRQVGGLIDGRPSVPGGPRRRPHAGPRRRRAGPQPARRLPGLRPRRRPVHHLRRPGRLGRRGRVARPAGGCGRGGHPPGVRPLRRRAPHHAAARGPRRRALRAPATCPTATACTASSIRSNTTLDAQRRRDPPDRPGGDRPRGRADVRGRRPPVRHHRPRRESSSACAPTRRSATTLPSPTSPSTMPGAASRWPRRPWGSGSGACPRARATSRRSRGARRRRPGRLLLPARRRRVPARHLLRQHPRRRRAQPVRHRLGGVPRGHPGSPPAAGHRQRARPACPAFQRFSFGHTAFVEGGRPTPSGWPRRWASTSRTSTASACS